MTNSVKYILSIQTCKHIFSMLTAQSYVNAIFFTGICEFEIRTFSSNIISGK